MFYYSPEAVRQRKLLKSIQPRKSRIQSRNDIVNCHSCKHFVECDNIKKSFYFLCNRYEQLPDLKDQDYLELLAFDGEGKNEQIEKERDLINNINSMIEKAITDQSLGVQTDFLLEDQDIPLADNFVDFYVNPRYGWGITPFAKQIEAAIELLTEYCHNPSCTDVAYARCIPTAATVDQIQEKVTLLKHGVCPKCNQTRFDMWDKYKARKGNTLVLCSGQRSSKDWETGLLSAYQDHRFIKLRKPALTYHHAPGTLFYQTFTAIDFSQAKKATFQPYKEFIQNSKWFKEYHAMLDHVGQKHGMKMYNIGEEAITWNYHGLATIVSSPDVRALRGIARRGWSISELAYFYTKTKSAVRLDSEGIIEALNNSMLGVASGYQRCLEEGKFDTPPPLTFLPSSPRSIRDPIMSMLKMAEEDRSIVARHYSSFEFNPNLKETDPFVTSLKIRNPTKYRTSILAIPSDSASAFIPDKRLFINCIDKTHKNAITGRNKETISPTKVRLTSGTIKINSKADTSSPKILSLDASLNQNSFAMAIMHVEEEETGNFTVVDGLYEIIPSKNKPCDYPDIYENIIVPICETLNVQMVMTDRYPAGKQLIQNLDKDLEIPGLIRSAKYPDYVTFKQALFNGTIVIPEMECSADDCKNLAVNNYPHSFERKPVAHTMMQAITVEDLMGKKVDKGEGFTDDLFYALVNGYAACNDPELIDHFLGDGMEEAIQDELVAVSRGYDGRSSDVSIRGGQNQGNDLIAVYRGYRDR